MLSACFNKEHMETPRLDKGTPVKVRTPVIKVGDMVSFQFPVSFVFPPFRGVMCARVVNTRARPRTIGTDETDGTDITPG